MIVLFIMSKSTYMQIRNAEAIVSLEVAGVFGTPGCLQSTQRLPIFADFRFLHLSKLISFLEVIILGIHPVSNEPSILATAAY